MWMLLPINDTDQHELVNMGRAVRIMRHPDEPEDVTVVVFCDGIEIDVALPFDGLMNEMKLRVPIWSCPSSENK